MTSALGLLIVTGAAVPVAWAAVVLVAGRALIARTPPRHPAFPPEPPARLHLTRAAFTLRS